MSSITAGSGSDIELESIPRIDVSHDVVLKITLDVPTDSKLQSIVGNIQRDLQGVPNCLSFDSKTYAAAQRRIKPKEWGSISHVEIRGNVERDIPDYRFDPLIGELANLKHLTLRGVGDLSIGSDEDEGRRTLTYFLTDGFLLTLGNLETLKLEYSGFDAALRTPSPDDPFIDRSHTLNVIADLTKLELWKTRGPDYAKDGNCGDCRSCQVCDDTRNCTDLIGRLFMPLMSGSCGTLKVLYPEQDRALWEEALEKCFEIFYENDESGQAAASKLRKRITMVPQLSPPRSASSDAKTSGPSKSWGSLLTSVRASRPC